MRRRRVIVPGRKQRVADLVKPQLEQPGLTVARADVEGMEHAVDLRQHMADKADPATQLAEQVGRKVTPAEAELARRLVANGKPLPNRKARRKAIRKRKRYERPIFKGIAR